MGYEVGLAVYTRASVWLERQCASPKNRIVKLEYEEENAYVELTLMHPGQSYTMMRAVGEIVEESRRVVSSH